MLSRVLESKILYIVLSLLLAIALWAYVVIVENKDIEVQYAGIPVTIVGEEQLLDTQSLILTGGHTSNVSLTLRGKRSVFARVDRDRIGVTVDVSGILAAGQHALEYDVSLPPGAGSLVVAERSRKSVDVTVTQFVTMTVPLDGFFNGSVAEGYLAEDFFFYPSFIEVSGPQEEVEIIDHARVTITEENLTRSVSETMPFELISREGLPVNTQNLLTDRADVLVRLPITTTREIPLSVAITPGGGAGSDHAVWSVSPRTILVSGEEQLLNEMKSLRLGPVDLAKVNETGTFLFPIALPEGILNQSGVHDATVTVNIEGLAVKTLEVQSIDVINVTSGYTAAPLTQMLPVTVRGPAETVSRISPEDIRVVANLTDIGNATGNYTVPAVITLDGHPDAGAVGDYKIVVSVTR